MPVWPGCESATARTWDEPAALLIEPPSVVLRLDIGYDAFDVLNQ